MKAMFTCLFLTAIFATIVGFTSRPSNADPISVVTYQGKTAQEWYRVNVRHRVERDRARSRAGDAIRAHRRDRRLYLHRADVLEAIRLAAVTWHVDYGKLVRRAMCESVLSPTAKNRFSSASGLFQFLDSTWASTPYGRESVWSPYSNALAAGWMSSHGRDGEWTCR